jgi:hypothetical protein
MSTKTTEAEEMYENLISGLLAGKVKLSLIPWCHFEGMGGGVHLATDEYFGPLVCWSLT